MRVAVRLDVARGCGDCVWLVWMDVGFVCYGDSGFWVGFSWWFAMVCFWLILLTALVSCGLLWHTFCCGCLALVVLVFGLLVSCLVVGV